MRINLWSGIALIVFSVASLAAVTSGYFTQPQPDEGTGAHVFQLAIMSAVMAAIVYIVTAEWRSARRLYPLIVAAAVIALAFAALYRLEHD